MSEYPYLKKNNVIGLVYPTLKTLDAIRRFRDDRCIKISFREFLDIQMVVYPEYTENLQSYYENFTNYQKIICGGSKCIKLRRHLVVDNLYENKVRLAKRYCPLSIIEIENFNSNIFILLSGGNLKSRFRDHGLTKNGSQDLRGFRSFLVHWDPLRLPDDKMESVICLYYPTNTILYLANFGIQNKVYKQCPISHEESASIPPS